MTEQHLAVSEVFGPTLQGEGPSLGRRAAFVRVARCNLTCTWCDAAYTWDWRRHDPAEEVHRMPVAEVAEQVLTMDCPLVVLTGGEPLLQQRGLADLAARVRAAGCEVEVETNGTRMPDPRLSALVRYNVSPKLANSGMPVAQRIKPDVLGALARQPGAVFKFVVANPAELAEVAGIVHDTEGLAPSQVWVMPEGVTAVAVLAGHEALADLVVARGWNMTTRLHVLAWGNERGR